MAKIQPAKLISAYLSMRAAISALDASTKEEKDSIQSKMGLIEVALARQLKADGVNSYKANGIGTAFTTTNKFVGVENFNEFLGFIVESILIADLEGGDYEGRPIDSSQIKYILDHADLQFLNKVVNKTAVLDYMKVNEDKLPPGIKYTTEKVIQVRK